MSKKEELNLSLNLRPPQLARACHALRLWVPAGTRRRRTSGASGFSGGGGAGSNMLCFYTADAPGLKVMPTVVLVMSLCFIGFVTALHVFGKLYRYRYSFLLASGSTRHN